MWLWAFDTDWPSGFRNRKLVTPKTVRDLSSRQLVRVRLRGLSVLELTGALPLHVYLLTKLADPEGIEPPSAGVGIRTSPEESINWYPG